MFTESITLTGRLRIVLRDAMGVTKEEREFDNLVVTVGKNYTASRMIGTADAVMSHMAIGTGTTAAVIGDTALQTEAGRVVLADSVRTDNAIAYTAVFGTGVGTGAITEAGILNAASNGTLLCRTVCPVINKGADDTLAVTWTVTVN